MLEQFELEPDRYTLWRDRVKASADARGIGVRIYLHPFGASVIEAEDLPAGEVQYVNLTTKEAE